MKNILAFILFFSFLACKNQPDQESRIESRIQDSTGETQLAKSPSENIRDSISYGGVLLLYTDSLQMNSQELNIFNQDNSIFTSITSRNGNEPASDKLSGKILAYYPDYYIVHFNADKLSEGVFRVKVGNDSMILKATRYVEFLRFPDYVLKFFATTSAVNPLKISPSESASEIKGLDYEQLSFNCLEIVGDWVKVACNAECEGCPEENSEIVGWIRWRKDGKIVIKQHYVC
jgi:hypothetical protein